MIASTLIASVALILGSSIPASAAVLGNDPGVVNRRSGILNATSIIGPTTTTVVQTITRIVTATATAQALTVTVTNRVNVTVFATAAATCSSASSIRLSSTPASGTTTQTFPLPGTTIRSTFTVPTTPPPTTPVLSGTNLLSATSSTPPALSSLTGIIPTVISGSASSTTRPSTTPVSSGTTISVITIPSSSTSTTSPATTTVSSPPALDLTQQNVALVEHNRYRAQHGAQPLVTNLTLVAMAKTWADRCVFAHGGTFGAGQNLAAWSGYTDDATSGTSLWEAEAPDYNALLPVASHFTQMVWKSTASLGCWISNCSSLAALGGAPSQFLVCDYFPPGNVFPNSNFLANVS